MHYFILDNNIVFSVENQQISAKKAQIPENLEKHVFLSIFTVKFAKTGRETPETNFKVQNLSNFIYFNDVKGFSCVKSELLEKS